MISLADISGLVSPIEKYKPWWETAVNLVLQLLMIIAIVTWGSVFLSSQELICMPQNSTIDAKTKFGLVEAKFVNARCSQEQEVEFITIMPYFLFLHWLFCYLIHNIFWIIPWTSCRLENVFFTLKEFQKFTPTNVGEIMVSLKKDNHQPFEYGDEKSEVLRAFSTKMSEKEILRCYKIKITALLIVFLVGGACLDGYAINLLWQMRSGYISCNLTQEIANFKTFTCIFLPGCFILCALVFHGILLFLAIIFWTISICKSRHLQVDVPKECEIIGKGTQGKNDASFCVWLLQESTKDGGFTKHRLFQKKQH